MADRPLLYSYRRCPYAMRARMALLISNTAYDLHDVVLRDKPPEMLLASPKGTVPVLLLPNGDVIDESLDIMRWALARHDPEGWLGQDESLILSNDGPFKRALDRYKYPNRHGVSDASIPRGDAMEFLSALNSCLAETAYLSGTTRTLTDIAIFPFVRQFAATDRTWFDAQPLPHLRGWLDGLIASPLFVTIMARTPI
ncbi:MAG: glutathione S-transferase [Chakrabartia sp.]